MTHFPQIDMAATGRNIIQLRKAKGYSVRDLQRQMGFEDPQAIYKWQWGRNLPSIDNLVVLSCILEVPVDRILVVKQESDQGPFPFIGELKIFCWINV